jgi:hypothetical protein
MHVITTKITSVIYTAYIVTTQKLFKLRKFVIKIFTFGSAMKQHECQWYMQINKTCVRQAGARGSIVY